MTGTADDLDLLRRSSAGDREAFDVFVRRHEAVVYRYLSSLSSSSSDTEDALQDCFVAAWRSAGTELRSGSARGWLFAIGRNALRRLHRRRAGQPADFESIDDLGLEAGWGRIDARPLEDLMNRDLLLKALDKLVPEDREVLILRDVEGFSGLEAAEMLGLKLPAVKSRLHRARLRLVAAIEETDHE